MSLFILGIPDNNFNEWFNDSFQRFTSTIDLGIPANESENKRQTNLFTPCYPLVVYRSL